MKDLLKLSRKLMFIAPGFLFPLFSTMLWCQPAADSLLAVSHIERSVYYLENKQFDSSEIFRLKAEAYFIAKDDLTGWIGFARDRAKAYEKRSDNSSALDLLKHTDATLPRSPGTDGEWEKVAWLRVKIAWLLLYGEKPDLEAAVHYYESAKRIFEQRLDHSDPDAARYIYRELGNLYTRLGDYQAAKITLETAKKISIGHGLQGLAAGICSDLSIIYRDLGQYDEAIAACREGIAFENVQAFSRGLLHTNLSKALRETGRYDEALEHSTRAQSILEEVTLRREHWRSKAWLSDAFSVAGEINTSLGRYELAEQQLQKALAIAEEHYADDLERREIAKLVCSFGNLYLAWGEPRVALDHFHKALRLVMPAYETASPESIPDPALIYAENTIKEALLGKARALEVIAVANGNQEYLLNAVNCRKSSFEVAKKLRQAFQFESSKLQIIEESQQECERAIELSLQYGQSDKMASVADAFYFTEVNKSVLLSEALRTNAAGSLANLPDSLLKKVNAIEEEIVVKEKAIFRLRRDGKDTTGQISLLEEALLRDKQAEKELMQDISERFPSFFQLRYEEDIAGISEMQHLLGPDQALVEYFVGDRSIFIFLITSHAWHIETVEKDFPLEEWVARLRQDIEAFQFAGKDRSQLCESYTAYAQDLYDRLLRPLEKKGLPEHLVIVPGGILGFLPFDALLYEKPAATCQFKQYPYLIRRHTISYNYSATLFRDLASGERQKAGCEFAGFAPAFQEGNSSGFGPLRFNIQSVMETTRLMEGQAFVRSASSSKTFREQARRFDLIYLATHARANTDEGDFSFIVLGDENEGYDTLFVKDIYQLSPLNADLIFLGACETGSGERFDGEGIISLARSFLYAGSKSIVTTLWSINDESNKNVTLSFFNHLKNGYGKDVALRMAQLEMLESDYPQLYAHPVFWASYTPIGDMRPVERPFSLWVWVFAGAFVIALGVGIRRNRKKLKSGSGAVADEGKIRRTVLFPGRQ